MVVSLFRTTLETVMPLPSPVGGSNIPVREDGFMEFTDYDTRVGAYAVIVRDGHVLLALWNEPAVPTWTLPGGGVELDESTEEGAVREVREETGYDVALGAVMGVDTVVMAPDQRLERQGDRFQRNVRVVFAATVTG